MEKKKYPIYMRDEGVMPDGLYLGLFHGFENEDEREKTDDWGTNGALIGPLKYAHTTYACHIKFDFMDGVDFKKYGFENAEYNDIPINKNGCVEFDGMEYGDWTVFYIKNGKPVGVPETKKKA